MPQIAFIEVPALSKRGHGLLVADNLLVTSAHVVCETEDGDVLPYERQHAHEVFVYFSEFEPKEPVRAFLHNSGWGPGSNIGAGFPCDLAILRVNWPGNDGVPQGITPTELQYACPDEAAFSLRCYLQTSAVEQQHGKLPSGFALSSKNLECTSDLAITNHVLEFLVRDNRTNKPQSGWSGAPVMASAPRQEKRCVAIWTGAQQSTGLGQAISADLVRKLRDHCLNDLTALKPRSWRPHPFTQDVRREPPVAVEETNPVTGQVHWVPSDDLTQPVPIEIATGFSGVVSLDLPDAGEVRLGMTSADLVIAAEHMNLQPFNRVDIGDARGVAKLKSIPMS